MKLGKLVERNLAVRKLSSLLTASSVALGVMLVSTIIQLKHEMHESYMRPGRGYSLVVGAPGSSLQLVLSAIYHVNDSPGLMPMSAYDELRRSPSVQLAVPYAVGDSFRGFRVVGTTSEFFSSTFPHPEEPKLAAGRAFAVGDEDVRAALAGAASGRANEAVLGADVAAALGLSVGDAIEPSHGVDQAAAHEGAPTWTVVGILARSDTPVDRVVWIGLDSFFRIPEHAGGIIADSGEQGLSAVVLFPRPGVHKAMLLARLNKQTDIQVADVQEEVRNLFRIVGNLDRVFLWVAVLVVVIGVVSIMVAIYNTMTERRVEIATLRALGAGRRTVFALVLGEAMTLAAAGGMGGILLGHALVWALRSRLQAAAGLSLDPFRLSLAELAVLGAVVGVGAAAGMLPAWKAYRTDVASNLSASG